MSAVITNVALTANVVTITTFAPHGFPLVFDGNPTVVGISGLTNSVLDGVWVLSAVTSTTFSFALTHSNIVSVADTGVAKLYSGEGLRTSGFADADNWPTAARLLLDDPAKAGSQGLSLAVLLVALDTVHGFTKQQYAVEAALTDGATVNWNLDVAQAASLLITGNHTLANPTNQHAGATYTLRVVQDGTGGRTLAYGGNYKWPSGVAPVLSTSANAVDILSFLSDGTNMYGSIVKGMS